MIWYFEGERGCFAAMAIPGLPAFLFCREGVALRWRHARSTWNPVGLQRNEDDVKKTNKIPSECRHQPITSSCFFWFASDVYQFTVIHTVNIFLDSSWNFAGKLVKFLFVFKSWHSISPFLYRARRGDELMGIEGNWQGGIKAASKTFLQSEMRIDSSPLSARKRLLRS